MSDEDLVFAEIDGGPVNLDNFSSRYYRQIRAKKLPVISFHGLRHTLASLMLAADVPLKVTSDLLGHASIVITADIYSHVLGSQRADAAKRLDTLLCPPADLE
jgi:integrase